MKNKELKEENERDKIEMEIYLKKEKDLKKHKRKCRRPMKKEEKWITQYLRLQMNIKSEDRDEENREYSSYEGENVYQDQDESEEYQIEDQDYC